MIKVLKSNNELTKKETLLILLNYLEEQEELTIREMASQENFNKASWAEFQAYKLGMLKAFSRVREFLPDQGELT